MTARSCRHQVTRAGGVVSAALVMPMNVWIAKTRPRQSSSDRTGGGRMGIIPDNTPREPVELSRSPQ